MLYRNVRESFEFFVVPQHEGDPDLVNFETARKLGVKEEGGAIFAQLFKGRDGESILIRGTYFPKKYADQIGAVIENWREFRGIPQMALPHHPMMAKTGAEKIAAAKKRRTKSAAKPRRRTKKAR